MIILHFFSSYHVFPLYLLNGGKSGEKMVLSKLVFFYPSSLEKIEKPTLCSNHQALPLYTGGKSGKTVLSKLVFRAGRQLPGLIYIIPHCFFYFHLFLAFYTFILFEKDFVITILTSNLQTFIKGHTVCPKSYYPFYNVHVIVFNVHTDMG